ncbi:outer membrane beta-barrel protein [uncultured Arcticibacterium sp.]|uniref:outer membrane beta-barrel protein n=1 Tax=uncultured Arcticibacterium sp. TaxID=2173042 RepID=UPI0030FC4E14
MKYKVLVPLLMFFALKSFSQDSKFNLEFNYPIPVGDNFIVKNYFGTLDLGAKYRFTESKPFNMGASLNSGILLFSKSKVITYLIQPKLFGELNIESLKRLHPTIGLGYTFMLSSSSFDENIDNQAGLNLNASIAYEISSKLSVITQYDYIKLNVKNNIPNTNFNTKIRIIKIGLGYHF